MIRFRDVCKRFHGSVALDSISLDIETGTVHAIVGENGAGKSTLLKILGGVHQPDSGTIEIDNEPVQFANPRAAQKAGISTIYQELNLIPQLTVSENILLGKEPRTRIGTVDKRAAERVARDLLTDLGLNINPNRRVASLRIGEQQLVEIAKALTENMRILILDEPTSALTEVETELLFRVMRRLKDRGVTLIYISHKLNEILEISDTTSVLRDGHHIGTWPTDDLDEHQIVHHMVGRDLTDLFPKTTVDPGEVVLEANNVSSRSHGDRRSIRDISFTVRAGEIVGISGLMGSGRTETLEAIAGVTNPRILSGSVTLNGRARRFRSPREAIRSGIAMVPEDRKNQSLVHQETVMHNMTLSSLKPLSRFGTVISRRERQAASERSSQLALKAPSLSANIDALSGGNQQKVVLAKYLLTRPSVLLLDEPTRGIDVHAKAEIYDIMSNLAEAGTAIVMVSSELPEIMAMCDRVLVMHEGRIVRELDATNVSQEDIMAAATGNSVIDRTIESSAQKTGSHP